MTVLPYTRKQVLEALGHMYTPGFGDLHLRVEVCLTEPTCPTAVVSPEYGALDDDPDDDGEGPIFAFRYDADTIDEAIDGALGAAFVTLVLRQPQPQTTPWTEPTFAKPLAAFLARTEEQAKAALAAITKETPS